MNEITYTRHGDYLLPDLSMPEQEPQEIGRYGLLRRTYLRTRRKGLYTILLTRVTLNQHLAEVDRQANDMRNQLVRQMAAAQNITEKLKAENQMAWIGAMNQIRVCADEIVLKELIYV